MEDKIAMKVSVCLATYNGEKYLYKQLESVLSQLSENDELIISDDSSTDRTIQVIDSFRDDRIKFHINSFKKGVVGNFENALRKANGDYIFLCDQDDIWYPDKLEVMLRELLGGADLVLSDCAIVDENLSIVHKSFFKFNNSKSGVFRNLMKNSYIGCCMAFNRKVLNLALPFPEMLPMHDSWIGLIAEIGFNTVFIQQPLIYYRMHGDNASQTAKGQSEFNLAKKIRFRLMLLKGLIKVFTRPSTKFF